MGWFVILVGLTTLASVSAVYWLVVLVQVARTARLPTARDGLKLAGPSGAGGAGGAEGVRVCVVIPAHNERAMLPGCARSLLGQDWRNLRIVFALDRCTDGSAAALREVVGEDPRVVIHEISACPEDWAGKVHACWSAVNNSAHAEGAEWLLFADADTVFEPGCVRATVGLAERRGLDLLSLLSTLEVRDWFEWVAQPAAGVELLRQYPPTKVSGGRHGDQRPFANGQFMLFRRGPYDRMTGHAAAKDELLEDIALARRLWYLGGSVGLLFADGMVRCRMYESWSQFRRGWKRIYTEAANRNARRLAMNAWRLRLTGCVLPTASIAALGAGAAVWLGTGDPLGAITASAGAAALGLMVVALGAGFRLSRTPMGSVALYPMGAWLTAGILAEAGRDLESGVATEWAGRTYARPVRTRRKG
jgi:glycosyltransferase involved in cell wall biosynthesis